MNSQISNATQMRKSEPVQPARFLVPANFQEAFQIADMLSNSDMVPKNYKGKPADIVIAMAQGAELGLQPLQSLQNIAVINGRPSLWGDAFRALIVGSPDLVGFKEWYDDNTQTAYCSIQRRLASGAVVEFGGSFGVDDAKTAGLWGKQGPWTQYPKRMQQWRALGFAGRDAYADRLRGIWIDAEAQDLPPEREINSKQQAANQHTGSKLEQVLASADVEQVTDEPQQQALPSPFENLSLSLNDCSSLEELNEVAAAIAEAVKVGKVNDSERKHLGSIYNNRKAKLEPQVDTETGEIND